MSVTITKCPFQPGIMITASDKFWGRMSERLTLISRLQNMGSTAINGSRRIGKSSLAYFVYNYCKSHFQDVEAIWIDCQNNKLTTLDGFFKEIQKNSSLSYTSGKSKDECLSNFIDSIRSSSNKTAIFIDEFELLTDVSHEQQFDKNFYLQLRMLGQEGKLAMVLVSKEPLREICKHVLGVSSPFYNIFNSVPLLVFSEDDVRNFLSAEHDGFKFSKKEIRFIKNIEGYRHPLILQIASEALFINRQSKENEEVLKKKIYDQINNYLNHEEVQLEREKEKEMAKQENKPNRISKPLDLTLSFLVPALSIGLLILEFGLLFQRLDNFKAILLATLSVIFGMVLLIFAGRSINIINETTFYKLYTQLIKKIPLLSSLLNVDIKTKK